jgi:hypothetical protein
MKQFPKHSRASAIKSVLYFLLLAAEVFVDVTLLMSLWMTSMYIPFAVAIVATVALLIWQVIVYTKTADLLTKRNTLFIIPLALLIPVAVFIMNYVIFAVAFIIMF